METTAAHYYAYFDQQTKGGNVLDADWSSETLPIQELSTGEEEERQAWNSKFDESMEYHMNDDLAMAKVDSTKKLSVPPSEQRTHRRRTEPHACD